MKCRFHVQTAGCSLTAQQPENNIVRTTLEALGAVLGGCQSLHTNSMDETFALPTEKSVTIALRTQQILAHESGVTNTIDPLGGSYFVEKLTSEMEVAALDYIHKIDAMGGMIAAIRNGYPQMEIANASHYYQNQLEQKEKIIVGVNEFVMKEDINLDTLKIAADVEKRQIANLAKVRESRKNDQVKESLQALRKDCEAKNNIMPALMNCARAYATVGEISAVLREVYGEYHDPGIY
ncbi:MAG: hypothetical protein ACD_73C00429G0003 [uncultured bacterium]|nr:MAG: hypothetical protein ACD_73C00429G0003 [uncultured bacterium]